MENQIISSQTESASAKVVLTSAVGTGRQACSPAHSSGATTMSIGRKSMAFITSTQTNTVSAAGATNVLRSPWWKMPFTWSSMNSISISTNAWRLFGTPAVAPRTTHQMAPIASAPTSSEVIRVSTFNDQKPPSPTGFVRKVRWCWM
jgi:hypothetical protein